MNSEQSSTSPFESKKEESEFKDWVNQNRETLSMLQRMADPRRVIFYTLLVSWQHSRLERLYDELAELHSEANVRSDNLLQLIPRLNEEALSLGYAAAFKRFSKSIMRTKAQDEALPRARKERVRNQKEDAEKKQRLVIRAIADLFDKPDKPGWLMTNERIADFIADRNNSYARSTILTIVKSEAARHRREARAKKGA